MQQLKNRWIQRGVFFVFLMGFVGIAAASAEPSVREATPSTKPARCLGTLSEVTPLEFTQPRVSKPAERNRITRRFGTQEDFESRWFDELYPKVLDKFANFTERSRVETLLAQLAAHASDRRLHNLRDWMSSLIEVRGEGTVRTDQYRHILLEGEYALFLLKTNANYGVYFEPQRCCSGSGFLSASGIGPKRSMDLAVEDMRTEQIIGYIEVKGFATRAKIDASILDGFEKIEYYRSIEGSGKSLSLVMLYDYDPAMPDISFSINHPPEELAETLLSRLQALRTIKGLVDNPVDSITLIDFGSNQVIYLRRQPDNTYKLDRYVLTNDPFIVFNPALSLDRALGYYRAHPPR